MGLEAARVCCGLARGGGGGTAGRVAGAGRGGTRPENGDWEPPNADEDVVEPPNILENTVIIINLAGQWRETTYAEKTTFNALQMYISISKKY